ncbi:putative protein [Zhongshania aliphaticivorans]|uniref:Phytanoyl-CoA dioxygenase n=1 Tax=Zhongshania aliphaticivorans TaxID=1470434 RepID=A0A5S9P5Y4_9GAMM|nr:phytanoyl-CoA dioxygenase family protein [Zhongshania aliphaticivorans]CAA0091442.1 putative protein [Zhongshania aliphaticivorans]CAA0098819.1 putative protein [Zhongshania aliphaticivorans]
MPTVEDYKNLETAKRYKKTFSDGLNQIDPDVLQKTLQTLDKNGYVIIPDVLSEQTLAEIKAAVEPMLNETGRNYFEGENTQRIYSVIAKTFACNDLVDHPLIMALLDSLFNPGYLLSQLQVINILPGEKQQPIHTDDAFYLIPRPRQPLGAATVWAINDFTADNGGTIVIPGSHQWGEEQPTQAQLQEQINCEMKAGSVVFFLGTLWHGGGANCSDQRRLAVTAQYCEGFCRSQENFSLSIPKDRVAKCSEDIKRLLGYSIFGPFMGMVDGKHPKRLLE